ncbi:MAG: GNVR domain-containing protein [Polaribacter sp.]
MSDVKQSNTEHVEDSIDIVALLKKFWLQRKLVMRTTALFFGLGLFVALLSKNYFSTSTTIVPVTQSSSVGGNLGGLASLAGINLGGGGSSGGEISPELYPEIVSSIPFKLELLNTPLTIEGIDSTVTYHAYYENYYSPGFLANLKKYTLGLPGVIIGALKSDEVAEVKATSNNTILRLSEDEAGLIKQLDEQIQLNVNAKEGFISLTATLPEAEASAQLALKAQNLLQRYALQFKTQKSIEQLAYIEERFAEKEQEFNAKKMKYASFQDKNRGINTALAQSQLLQLQAEYDIAFAVYTELAKQLETQRLQVKKDTPIFTILKPVSIPKEKAGPKKALILVIYTFLGFVLSLGYVLAKDFLKDFKKDWDKA